MSIQYFKDSDKKIINEQLLDAKAEQVAKSFFKFEKGRRPRMVSSSQLRKFYNEVKALEKKLDNQPFAVVYPLIKMVKSKVAYATAPSKIGSRDEIPLYKNFKDFLMESIDSIPEDGEKEFRAFCTYFEAVVGYYYGNGGK